MSASVRDGLPWCVTRALVDIDGEQVPNPLASFQLPEPLRAGSGSSATAATERPAGYTTTRFPFGSAATSGSDPLDAHAIKAAHKVEAELKALKATAEGLLNQSVVGALRGVRTTGTIPDERLGAAAQFRACLDAPTYLLFSNKRASDEYNSVLAERGATAVELVQSISAPFAGVALAVGGHCGVLPSFASSHGAMSAEDTASLDPLYFLHLCFADYVFHAWQLKHGATRQIEPAMEVSGDSGSLRATAAVFSAPLAPFVKRGSALGSYVTSNDVADIGALGYAYERGSVELPPPPALGGAAAPVLVVKGLTRSAFESSFTVFAYAELPPTLFSAFSGAAYRVRLIGFESVLSHSGCARCGNCKKHLDETFFFPLYDITQKQIAKARFFIRVADTAHYAKPRQRVHYQCFVNGVHVSSPDELPGADSFRRPSMGVRRPSARAAKV